MRYLIEKGANIHHRANRAKTILQIACYDGFKELVKFILEFPEIDVESKDELDYTALHFAVWGLEGHRTRKKASKAISDSPECARLLLEKGADPNTLN